jgi:hypothetical protein
VRGATSLRTCVAMRLAGALGLALFLFLVLVGVGSGASRQFSPVARPSAPDTPIWLGNPVADKDYATRHIWDLQVWRGRVYLGYGDWLSNTGPVDIWYYTPTAGCFVSETVYVSATQPAAQVDEEAIHRYVVIDGDLYIPGVDSKESWALGNFYRNDGGGWVKYRTILSGVHVFDLAGYDGGLFAAIGTDGTEPLLRSPNRGLTWTAAISEGSDIFFTNLYELDGTLFAVKSPIGPADVYTKPVVYCYQPPWFVTTTIQLVPDRPALPIFVYDDMVAFKDTVLYVPWSWETNILHTWPLTALHAIRTGQNGQSVPFFEGRHPRDIAVADGRVYVLDAGGPRDVWDREPPDPAGYTATVYASMNLVSWLPVATAHFTDTPDALEVLDGVAYVGTYNGDIYALPLNYHVYYLPLVRRR